MEIMDKELTQLVPCHKTWRMAVRWTSQERVQRSAPANRECAFPQLIQETVKFARLVSQLPFSERICEQERPGSVSEGREVERNVSKTADAECSRFA